MALLPRRGCCAGRVHTGTARLAAPGGSGDRLSQEAPPAGSGRVALRRRTPSTRGFPLGQGLSLGLKHGSGREGKWDGRPPGIRGLLGPGAASRLSVTLLGSPEGVGRLELPDRK